MGPGWRLCRGATSSLWARSSVQRARLFTSGAEDDPGQVALTSNGASAMFLSRHAPDGHLAWAAVATSTLFADPRALTGDATGVVVAGVYQGTMTFNEGKPGRLCSPRPRNRTSSLLASISHGALIWVKTVTGPGNEFVEDVTTLSDGSIGVVGYYEDGAQFGDVEPRRAARPAIRRRLRRAVLAAGDLMWVEGAGGQGLDHASGVAATADGGLVVTGSFEQDLGVFDRGAPEELTLLSAGSADFLRE